jgi:hypothetical protein
MIMIRVVPSHHSTPTHAFCLLPCEFSAVSAMENLGFFALTALFGLLVLVLVGLIVTRSTSDHDKDNAKKQLKHRPRSFSYTSKAMVAGSFPPSALMPETIINAVVWFDGGCPETIHLAEEVVTPMLSYTRLNSIPDAAMSRSRPSSQHYNAMDLIRVIQADVKEGEDAESSIYREIYNHLQDPLTVNRGDLPWWEILVVRNRDDANHGGRSAVVFRIHHGLADGISLVNVFGGFVKYQDGSPLTSLLENFTSTPGTSKRAPPTNRRAAVSPRNGVGTWLRELLNVLMLGMTRYDDDTAFSKHNHGGMTYSGNRRAVIFPSVPLDFVKAIKNAASVTINDVLMTAVSYAITEYCDRQNCPAVKEQREGNRTIQCRALLPVAFPRSKEQMTDADTALSNRWCFFSTDLGLHKLDILDRLHFIHKANLDIKGTPRVFLQLSIQNKILPFLPAVVGQKTLFDIMSRHSLVFSNVPGPDRPVVIAGKVVTGVQMLYANLIPQIGFLSYAGRVFGNIMLDPDAIPESSSLRVFYARALVALSSRLNVPTPQDLSKMASDDRL